MVKFTDYATTFYTEGTSVEIATTSFPDLNAMADSDCNPRATIATSEWISLDKVVQPTNAHLINYIECGAIIGNGTYMRGIATDVEMTDAPMSEGAIIDLIYTLPPEYRRDATFLFGSTDTPTRRKMLSLKDENGRYLVNAAVCAGEPDRLLGYPLIISDLFDGLIFGKMAEAYVIAKRPHAPNATSCWVGSGIVNRDAVRAIRFKEVD